MKRKLNYTGRERIKREKVSINLVERDGSVVSFDLSRLDIDDLNLPYEAKIYVEAYYRTELKRFDFGTVTNRALPPSLSLTDLAYPENLKFRILVVNPSDSKVLAHAVGITPQEPAEKRSILPVEFRDLGSVIYRVEYEGDGGSPILCMNIRIPNIENIARQDPQFLIYVYPAVVREILTHMIFVDTVDSVNDPTVEWHNDWLKFSVNLGSPPPETLDNTDENFDKNKALEWIDSVVTAFCNIYGDKFQEYVRRLEGNP
ncbi:MAG: hypothetical protein NC937_02085 [Candidatus Omnitrophica bacterium]|nr:hypothetical protein [Candidatus Omnitrophota bacterium]